MLFLSTTGRKYQNKFLKLDERFEWHDMLHVIENFCIPLCRFCIMGDGCAMEGISHEAASLAAHWKLNKLTLIYDDNHNTIDGPTTLAFSEDVSERFKALGWNTITVENIHDNINLFKDALLSAFSETEKPTLIRVGAQLT